MERRVGKKKGDYSPCTAQKGSGSSKANVFGEALGLRNSAPTEGNFSCRAQGLHNIIRV